MEQLNTASVGRGGGTLPRRPESLRRRAGQEATDRGRGGTSVSRADRRRPDSHRSDCPVASDGRLERQAGELLSGRGRQRTGRRRTSAREARVLANGTIRSPPRRALETWSAGGNRLTRKAGSPLCSNT